MKEMFRSFWDLAVLYRRRLAIIGAAALGVFVVVNGVFFVAANFPKSCVVCHYMDPFYDQWKTSTHAGVACIRCHPFRPVVNAVNTVKYWTGVYNPRPHADVPDASCLASNCHQDRIEKGKATLGTSVAFNHKEHMGKLKRGETLRCTSCHYSIVQGEHIAVDQNVCFLCHFKGIGQGQALGGCPGCHGTPADAVEHGGFRFSHESYVEIGVPCKQCHIRVAEGEGNVPDIRCFDCHVGRLEKKGDPLSIHRTHVTFEAYDCFKCHERIRHGEVELVRTFEVQCDACHKGHHDYEKKLYMGTGARGVPDTPSRMFSAQVSCDGCHTRAAETGGPGAPTAGAAKPKAERQNCVTCHGKKYDRMLDDWIRTSRILVADMGRIVAAGERAVGKGPARSKKEADARALVADARHNLDLLRAGHGAHNIDYAYTIVKSGYEQVAIAFKLAGAAGGPPRPAILASESARCTTLCHGRAGPSETVFFREMELSFPHALHVGDVGIECTTCHSPDKHKMRIVTKSECMACHHEERDIACGHCHKPQKALYEGTAKTYGVSSRPDVMAAAGMGCTDCHELGKGDQTVLTLKGKCEECHGAKYGKMLLDWKEEITAGESAVAVALEEARELLERSRKMGIDVEAKKAHLAQAEANYLAVTSGRGAHNHRLSLELLKAAQANLDRILEDRRTAD
jgi:hypothetical protein